MHISRLQYDLPPELIAQHPLPDRDQSRLLVLDRTAGTFHHHRFRDLPDLLRPPDCLVLNNTSVIPARFFARRQTGGRVEALFIREIRPGVWEVLLRSSGRLRRDEQLDLEAAEAGLILRDEGPHGAWTVSLTSPQPAHELLERIGRTPLPPYIHRPGGQADQDRHRYQTIYAHCPGAVAAPTAGLHFTKPLLEDLKRRGLAVVELTLHVGPGTFQPITHRDIRQHKMHPEWFRLPGPTVDTILTRRRAGGRIVAVGTTTVRVLESCGRHGPLSPASGFTDLFIYPPYRFTQVDAVLTNFHLPGSTLLAMVQAFAGPEILMAAYRQAIRRRYRFYSYGDAMLIV